MPAARIMPDSLNVPKNVTERRRSSSFLSEVHTLPTPKSIHEPEPMDDLNPYERLLHGLHHDERWLKEVTLGKRVGFYRFRGELGSGNFSQVKLAHHQLTKERVAIKVLDKNKLDQKTRKMLDREIETLESMNHPNLIRLYEVVETYTRIHLVTEYAYSGELYTRVANAGKLSESEAKPIFAQLVSAISYMHDRNFIHRDLKAENVMFSSNQIKVVDFGFSTKVNSPDQRLQTFCGSPPYAAPELFRDEWYTGCGVDIWALGVILYFMVTGTMPFRGHTVAALKRTILEGEFVDPIEVSQDCVSVIRGLMKPLPADRISLKTLLEEHSWLEKVPKVLPSVLDNPDCEKLKEVAAEAKKRLQLLGVSEALLAEAADKGAKSSITGCYRIVLHRVERDSDDQASLDNVDAREFSSPTPSRFSIASRISSRKSRRKSKLSTTCVIF
ncbi:serine/threonine-protein kinase NIM1-like [Neocloeon triangulifer]|uniref:serine/threonine-protein kinase NIM1-like n=1 Tax=Neocloeon triangulifer TaxID=2078957 RepID=UPI00286F4E1D|nr:serine/threonine-protein kinase NIM1-like [Neocloeon triangulifer]